jgi:hypothetical protein
VRIKHYSEDPLRKKTGILLWIKDMEPLSPRKKVEDFELWKKGKPVKSIQRGCYIKIP